MFLKFKTGRVVNLDNFDEVLYKTMSYNVHKVVARRIGIGDELVISVHTEAKNAEVSAELIKSAWLNGDKIYEVGQ